MNFNLLQLKRRLVKDVKRLLHCFLYRSCAKIARKISKLFAISTSISSWLPLRATYDIWTAP